MMKKLRIVLSILGLSIAFKTFGVQTEIHEHERVKAEKHELTETSEHDEHITQKEIVISDGILDELEIKTARVTKQKLTSTIMTYGDTALGSEQVSHVRARFAGLIKRVEVQVGDKVKSGDVLAIIEANTSLQDYILRAPIDGLVVQRHANTGEFTQDNRLFSLANFDTLWVQLRVYPSYYSMVKPEQSVKLRINNQDYFGKIRHVVPVLDKPYKTARILLNNTDQLLSTGTSVKAQITVNSVIVPLAVHKKAIQYVDGRAGVFVKKSQHYFFTPVQLGQKGAQYVEVISGVKQDTQYVWQHSFILKSELNKANVSHIH